MHPGTQIANEFFPSMRRNLNFYRWEGSMEILLAVHLFHERVAIATIVLPSTDKFPYKFKSVVREGGGPHQQEALGQNLTINKS